MSRWQAGRWRTWWATRAPWISAWSSEHLAVGTPGPTKHMRLHMRATVVHLGHAVLHGVEAWSRLAHHPWESRLAHGMESHSRRRRPSMKHHSLHWRLTLKLVRPSLPGYSRVLPRCDGIHSWYLLGRGFDIVGSDFGSAGLLGRPFSVCFLWDPIYTVYLEIDTFPPFLRVRHPDK